MLGCCLVGWLVGLMWLKSNMRGPGGAFQLNCCLVRQALDWSTAEVTFKASRIGRFSEKNHGFSRLFVRFFFFFKFFKYVFFHCFIVFMVFQCVFSWFSWFFHGFSGKS